MMVSGGVETRRGRGRGKRISCTHPSPEVDELAKELDSIVSEENVVPRESFIGRARGRGKRMSHRIPSFEAEELPKVLGSAFFPEVEEVPQGLDVPGENVGPRQISTGRTRGRGRRDKVEFLQIEDSSTELRGRFLASEDVVDAGAPPCDFADRFADDVPEIVTKYDSSPACAPKEEKVATACNREELFDSDGLAIVRISSVNFAERLVSVQFIKANQRVDCKVHLHENQLMRDWKAGNSFALSSVPPLKDILLSTLDLHVNETVTVKYLRDYAADVNNMHISIKIFKEKELKCTFINSILFFTIPVLPLVCQVEASKIGVITNLREKGEIDVTFYDGIWIGLREAVRSVQKNENLVAPRCLYFQEFYRSLILSFDVKLFLGTLNQDWKKLYRIEVLGIESDDYVKVVYIDLGKSATIPLNNLAIPLAAGAVPDMLYKIPPQAFTVRLDSFDMSLNETLMSMEIEGSLCFIQTVRGLDEIPYVNIFLNNDVYGGCVSLVDMAKSTGSNKKDLTVHTSFRHGHLKTISKRVERLTNEWLESMKEQFGSIRSTACTEDCDYCAA